MYNGLSHLKTMLKLKKNETPITSLINQLFVLDLQEISI